MGKKREKLSKLLASILKPIKKLKKINKFVYFYRMENQLSILKGIHPGFVLERELKKRNLQKGEFAISIQEHPQTLVSIMKGKRKMNTALSLKIETKLGYEEGYFMTLQVYFDIEAEKQKQASQKPDLSKLRPVIFWDTKIENINWQKNKNAVIKRVFERGNDSEKQEIERFYGLTRSQKI